MTPVPELQDDPGLAAIERAFGRCMLRAQALEVALKALIAAFDVSVVADAAGSAPTLRGAGSDRMTLGAAVRQFTDGQRTPGQNGATGAGPDMPVHLHIHLGAQPEEAEGLAALVAMRNRLAHGFVAAHPLGTPAGRITAAAELAAAEAALGQHRRQLAQWLHAFDAVADRSAETSLNAAIEAAMAEIDGR